MKNIPLVPEMNPQAIPELAYLVPFPIQNLASESYECIFGYLVGLLGRGISPSQGHYLHRKN
jgi:hypothetical protein